MRHAAAATTLSLTLFLFGGCATFNENKQSVPPSTVPNQLAVPIGKNWQIIEEAPNLTNELHEQRLPFQMEQSVQPVGAPPVSTEKPKIETPKAVPQ